MAHSSNFTRYSEQNTFVGDSHRIKASTPSRSTSSNSSSVDAGRFPSCRQPIGSADYQNNTTLPIDEAEDVEIEKILQRKGRSAALETPKRSETLNSESSGSNGLDATQRSLFTSDLKISNYKQIFESLNDRVEILKSKIRQNFSLNSADIENYYLPSDSKGKAEMENSAENSRGSLARRCLFDGSYVDQPPAKISKLADEKPSSSAGASTLTAKARKTRTALSVRKTPNTKQLAIGVAFKRALLPPIKSPNTNRLIKRPQAVVKPRPVRATPFKLPAQQQDSPLPARINSPGTSAKKSKIAPKKSLAKKPTSPKKTAGSVKKPISTKKKPQSVVKKSPSKPKPAQKKPKQPAVKPAAKKPTTTKSKLTPTAGKTVVNKTSPTVKKPKAVIKKVVKQVPSVKPVSKTNTKATSKVVSPKKVVAKKPTSIKVVASKKSPSKKSPRKALSSRNTVAKAATLTARKAVVKGSEKQLISRPSRSSAKLVLNTTKTVTVSSTTTINLTQRKKRV